MTLAELYGLIIANRIIVKFERCNQIDLAITVQSTRGIISKCLLCLEMAHNGLGYDYVIKYTLEEMIKEVCPDAFDS